MTDDHQALIERIEAVIFTPVRGQTGYEMGHVDDFLDGVIVALKQGRPVAPLVDMVRFSTTRFREGYVTSEVDQFLAGVVAQSQGQPEAAPDEAAPRSAEAHLSAQGSHTHDPGVVQEQRGLLSRLFRR